MKNTIYIGIIVLLIGILVTYMQLDRLSDAEDIIVYLPGVLVGIGLGLIFGSLIGYRSKGQQIKRKGNSNSDPLNT